METAEYINLVQFPDKTGHAAVVRRSSGEADDLASLIFDDEAKRGVVLRFKEPSPLALTNFAGRTTVFTAAVRLVVRCHVDLGQRRNVLGACLSNLERQETSIGHIRSIRRPTRGQTGD